DVVVQTTVIQEESLYKTPEQFEDALSRLGAITNTLKAGFGVRLDTGGERIYFVDEDGQQVNGMTALAAIVDLALANARAGILEAEAAEKGNGASNPKSKIENPKLSVAVPVWAPSIFERIAERHGAEIIRTRFNSYALMTAALRTGVVIAGDGQGSFIFPQFQPSADGLFAI